jgi:hypothetical protein
MLPLPLRRGLQIGMAGFCALAAAALCASAGGGDKAAVRYGRDIRPLLADRCFRCHGPDGAEREADLRLDERGAALAERDGLAAIVAGDPAASELWRRVTSDDPSERMPPPQSHKRPFDARELELVRTWIEAGAQYEPHWAFVPPARPEPPAVRDASWPRNAIDRFVLARLEQEGVAPSPEAEPTALLRRVFLDLTGLPPTPEEIEAFLADDSPEAYERTVQRLLTEEPYVTRYAERMAVPWLDAARYADTCGIHMDAGRQIWPWRDWLLGALRDGMPFDRFLTEQLAGDLLPDATDAQRVASGFNRNHVTTDEGGAIAEEYLVEYAVDRTATTGSVFLGLTLGCARCHEHKFDPVSQEDFYGLYAFFNSIEEPGLYSQETDPKRAFEPFLILTNEMERQRLEGLRSDLASAKAELAQPIPGEEEQRAAFLASTLERSGLVWAETRLAAARSSGGAQLELQQDGSLLASGENPAEDVHQIELETLAVGLRLVALEALTDASLPHGRVGRSPNGNAVLESIRGEAISLRDPAQRHPLRFTWAWADFEQTNGDFRVVNALADDGLGWAVDAHNRAGPRAALFLADEPFGFEGGTRVAIELDYDSIYPQHVFGRVRLSLATLGEQGLDALGVASSGWYATAPFSATPQEVWENAFGPESMVGLDLAAEFGPTKLRFNFVEQFQDERLNTELAGGINATYVARRVFSPTRRKIEVSLGSDDGFRLYVNRAEVSTRKVERGLAADQDRAEIYLPAGVSTIVLKIVNTGGLAGYYWRTLRRGDELRGAGLAALLPPGARWPELEERLITAWRTDLSPGYRERIERVASLERAIASDEAQLPRSMVMRELAKPRETFVLMRGQYDKPDPERPVQRAIPPALGRLPEGAPQDRLGLAQWLTSEGNPLVARVAVNRAWELAFGTGLVATSEDFGLQGEWPSHPELLDWLAVEFRESGWDLKRLLASLVTSATYRQSSRVRPELRELDPDDRLLARYPRRRLDAEQIRDQALYVSGLLVEDFGGPSVKPYQPDGLWQEIAMPQSNTREYERGAGADLWRRSLYTYWKRAAPPPAMLAFDAPTREYCTIRRGETSTPLQALVLWNDEQFVEAARALAERTLAEADADEQRLERMFLRCVGRKPDAGEARALAAALADFRARYAGAPEDARALLAIGEAPLAELDPAEAAAWTMIASALFSLDAMLCRG